MRWVSGVEGGRSDGGRWYLDSLCAKIDPSESGFMPGTRESTAHVFSWKLARSLSAQNADGNGMRVVRGHAS